MPYQGQLHLTETKRNSFYSSSRCITFFEVYSKGEIIIELACPCEDNMSQWHEEKSQKYYPLCCSIRSNGWSVYFDTIEVGAWGFCAESVRSCLLSLDFSNRLCRKTLQTLSSVSLRCSFEIWLCQNSKSWSLPHPVSMSNSEPTHKKFILYHHLKLPISTAELSVKGVHVMQMLFYNA